MSLDHLIYDFDGTLSDTYPCFTEAMLLALEHYGIHDSYENVYAYLKVNVRYCEEHYPTFMADFENANRLFHVIHERLALERQEPIEGAEEVLRYAHERGKKNYIWTHSKRVPRLLLEKWGLWQYCDDYMDGAVPFPRKPEPDALIHLMGKHLLDPRCCAMIGDRDIDVEAGIRAGMEGVLFDPEHFYDGYACKYRINMLTELKDIIS